MKDEPVIEKTNEKPDVEVSDEAAKPKRKPGYRCSVPPYYLGVVEGEGVFACLPGENYELLAQALAPSVAEVRAMLINMRTQLRWSRPMLGAYRGVGRDVVRRWEDGTRNPNGAARRLIWMLYNLAFHPKKLKNAVDVILWGRGEEMRQWNPGARRKKAAPVPAKPC